MSTVRSYKTAPSEVPMALFLDFDGVLHDCDEPEEKNTTTQDKKKKAKHKNNPKSSSNGFIGGKLVDTELTRASRS